MGQRANLTLIGTICLMLMLPFIASCGVRTPEIHGVVLDEKTKEVVKEAWIDCSVDLEEGRMGGPVRNSYTVSPPHLRTDDHGRFIIPSKTVGPALTIGTKIRAFRATAETIEDMDGGVSLLSDIRKNKVEVTIYTKPSESTESEKFSYLQALSRYCQTGRFSVEVPQGGLKCDDWELRYAIALHERFLKEFPEPKTISQGGHYSTHHSIALEQLAWLYKQKGDYQKSLETFVKVREYDQSANVTMSLRGYDGWIKELKQILDTKSTRPR